MKTGESAVATQDAREANECDSNPRAGVRGAGRLLLMAVTAAVVVGAVALLIHFAGAGELFSPARWLRAASPWTAAASLILLALDAVLPVPASLLMVANGALFGPVFGAALSTAGSLAASLLAFTVGRWAHHAAWRGDPQSLSHADDLLNRWGAVAVVLSRPVPLLAESVAMVAGAGQFSPWRFFAASLAGAIPASIVYAWIGAAALNGRPLLLLAAAYFALALTTVLLQRCWKSSVTGGGFGASAADQAKSS